MFELRHLRCFVLVAEELNFHRAAERLHLTQQQTSQTILRLEEIMGTRLFTRTTRSVAITDTGQVLLPRARQILADSDGVLKDCEMAKRGELGKLIVSFSGYAIESSLPRVFHYFREKFPKVVLDLCELNSGAALGALANGEVDACFAISPPKREGIRQEILLSSPPVLVVPTSTLSSTRRKHKLSDFEDRPFIHVPRAVAPGFYESCDKIFFEAGFSPKVIQYAQNTQSILGLVSAGAGVSIVPDFLQSLRKDGAKYIPLQSDVRIHLAMLSRQEDKRPLLRSLRVVAREIYGC